MKRPRPLAAGPFKRLRHKSQRTTSSMAQPKRVMDFLRTMHTELFIERCDITPARRYQVGFKGHVGGVQLLDLVTGCTARLIKPSGLPGMITRAGMHLMDFGNRAFKIRPAGTDDFQFVWSIYRDLMKPLTVELLGRWNETGQKHVVELALAQRGTFIIAKDELNVGWVQVVELPDTIYLGQLYVTPSSQNRGIGTAILRGLTDKARREGKILTLDVMKNNRSRALYERLGFQVIGQSEHKLKMQWHGAAR
jgi:ribosomal protein S18 acetylase RimI-like enzyme